MKKQCSNTECGKAFESKRSSARYCCDKCRVTGNRVSVTPVSVTPVSVTPVSVTQNAKEVSVTALSFIKDGVAHYAPDEPAWRIELINEILAGVEPGKLENHPVYGIIISDRSASDGVAYQLKKDREYHNSFHAAKKRDNGSNLKGAA